MYRVAICDDDISICNRIENILQDHSEANKISIEVHTMTSAEDLIAGIGKHGRFDLIYLDIELDGIDGIDAGAVIRSDMNDHLTKIVYISGNDSYSMRLFNNQPLNFLIKPLKEKDIIDSFTLSLKLDSADEKYFIFKASGIISRLPYSDILYMESIRRTIQLTCNSGSYSFYGKISDIADQTPEYIARIHRSFIVNMKMVKHFTSDSVAMSDDKVLPVSRTYQDEFNMKLKSLLMEEPGK